MPRTNALLQALNRGECSTLALARTDVDKLRLSAETQVNWQPRVLGPMSLRAGMEFLGEGNGNAVARWLPFVFATDDVAAIELTNGTMRVWVGGDDLITRPAVSTTVPAFSTWTQTITGSGSISTSSGLSMGGNSTGGRTIAYTTCTVGVSDIGVEHALKIVVSKGPVTLRVGTGADDDSYVSKTYLDTGIHSLAFTPTGSAFDIRIETDSLPAKVVTSVDIEAAGVMTVTSPWGTADLPNIRFDQSGDVIFVACPGVQQRRIERRSARSWSIAVYKPDDGPFGFLGDTAITMTPSATTGDVTITASRPYFTNSDLGSLIRLESNGQAVTASLSASDTYSDTVRISGVGARQRVFAYSISGTWAGVLTLQRSSDGPDTGFRNVRFISPTSDLTNTYYDEDNNVIYWYRIGFEPAKYTSGTALISLTFASGGGNGVARITSVASSTSVSAEVLKSFSSIAATRNWRAGQWSARNVWPSSVAIHEGRLWWSGSDRIWGSESDDYTSFDYDAEGDASTISRSIGRGPIQNVQWLLPLTRLMIGTDAAAITARSSSFDEPLTPTNFNLKPSSTQGAAALSAVDVDTRGIFVQRSGRRVYELAFDVQMADYQARDLTRLNDNIGIPGFVDLAVQRQPDTQIYLVRSDGQAAVLLYDTGDQVEAWWRIVTDGIIENVLVLPGTLEDRVFFYVRRVINGVTKRYWERLARMDECEGGTLNKQADAFVLYQGAPTATITGLSHLEGEEVIVWADGVDLSPMDDDGNQTTYTVTSGAITLGQTVSNAVIGMPYTATFKSAKLAFAAAGGTALTMKKKVDHVGLLMAKTHPQGVRYGQDEDHLDPMPLLEEEVAVDQNAIWEQYDSDPIPLAGSWNTDARLILKAYAPRPATVLGVVVSMETSG